VILPVAHKCSTLAREKEEVKPRALGDFILRREEVWLNVINRLKLRRNKP
jgi:hypothetical protein